MAAINWHRLLQPFPESSIEWRIGRSGVSTGKVWATCLAYVTARAIQERLDEVFGPAGWKNEFREGPRGGVLCRIYFRDEDGEWIWREDGGGEMEASRGLSGSDAMKGTYSAALKRAGSALGVGRYLYDLEEGFATIHDQGRFRAEVKDGNDKKRFRWDPPKLPSWALPSANPQPAPPLPSTVGGDKHAAMLEYIRAKGPSINDQATLVGSDRNLKDFIRESWSAIKEQESSAAMVVQAVEFATNTKFTHP